jgi:glycerophosphoryl diester phosphodiesterase
MRLVEPRLPCGLLVSSEMLPRWPRMRELALRHGLQAVSVFYAGINEQLVVDCRCSGLALYAWTADSKREIARLIELGVDGICTNFPDKPIALLR